MNIENAQKLIKYISRESVMEPAYEEKLKKGNHRYFLMSDYLMKYYDDDGNPCGTAGCICGCVVLMTRSKSRIEDIMRFKKWEAYDIGRKFLDISEELADKLFIPTHKDISTNDDYRSIHSIKKKHALYVLRRLIKMQKAHEIAPVHISIAWKEAFETLGR